MYFLCVGYRVDTELISFRLWAGSTRPYRGIDRSRAERSQVGSALNDAIESGEQKAGELLVAGITTRSKQLLGAPGLATRSKDATSSITTRNKKLLGTRALLRWTPADAELCLARAGSFWFEEVRSVGSKPGTRLIHAHTQHPVTRLTPLLRASLPLSPTDRILIESLTDRYSFRQTVLRPAERRTAPSTRPWLRTRPSLASLRQESLASVKTSLSTVGDAIDSFDKAVRVDVGRVTDGSLN